MAAAMDRKARVMQGLNVSGVVSDLFTRQTPAGAGQILVLCPAHDETTPSCSVNTCSGLWNCKSCGAAGNVFDLYMAVRGCDFRTALQDLEARAGISHQTTRNPAAVPPPAPKKDNKPKRQQKPKAKPCKVVAVYRYFDAAGAFQYGKERIEPGRDGKKKEFAFYHLAEDDTRRAGRGSSPPLLYGLHRLATAAKEQPVFVVEGEGKADALHAWGLIAVCTDSGAAGRWPESFNDLFKGRRAIILPDNDAPGEKYAARVAAALADVAASVELLRLPGLPEKGDLIDWINLQKGAVNE